MSDAGGSPPPPQPPAEAKPVAQDGNAPINIKLTSPNGDEIYFKIKKSTKLGKLCAAYAERVGADVATIRLVYEGVRVTAEQTALELELEDGDSIDVMLEQVGGGVYV
ncbi:hypothetical protein M231_00153 [Tremella mesenterica]|uniref:Ubiquitin-like domain-containing protein n=1 Tax=Tremella mesenterica TaxID=5217 RepID=A0A4Q1BWP6_TREME|nr:uncharacterized protein TREMEDRAFT_70849 [Tremella mesenterica DSM 1558]EIW72896.1 hypothetical protein TREMEDRAFT_70849 [Tremella mesenterica DSM 1558]RXK42599.1 hypothetical protein M231_00153 [Tremella mesenterica]